MSLPLPPGFGAGSDQGRSWTLGIVRMRGQTGLCIAPLHKSLFLPCGGVSGVWFCGDHSCLPSSWLILWQRLEPHTKHLKRNRPAILTPRSNKNKSVLSISRPIHHIIRKQNSTQINSYSAERLTATAKQLSVHKQTIPARQSPQKQD